MMICKVFEKRILENLLNKKIILMNGNDVLYKYKLIVFEYTNNFITNINNKFKEIFQNEFNNLKAKVFEVKSDKWINVEVNDCESESLESDFIEMLFIDKYNTVDIKSGDIVNFNNIPYIYEGFRIKNIKHISTLLKTNKFPEDYWSILT